GRQARRQGGQELPRPHPRPPREGGRHASPALLPDLRRSRLRPRGRGVQPARQPEEARPRVAPEVPAARRGGDDEGDGVSPSSTIPTAATPDVCTVAILAGGKEIPGQHHVLSVTVVRELNRIPTATIQIKDGEASLQTFQASDTGLFVPGTEIEIQLGYRSQ